MSFVKRIKYLVAYLKKIFLGGSKGLRLGAYPKAPYWKIVKGGQFGGLAWALGCSFYSLIKNKKSLRRSGPKDSTSWPNV